MHRNKYQSEDSLAYLINKASRTLRRYFSQELKRFGYGVTVEQFDLLVRLQDLDGQNQQQLAEILGKDKTTMTRLIKSIEALNLVRRVTDKKKASQKIVFLTDLGEKAIKDLSKIAQGVLVKSQKGIAPTDITTSKKVLKRIYETLSEE